MESKNLNELSKVRAVNTENKLVVARGEGAGRLGTTGEGEQEIQAPSLEVSKSQE